MVGFTQAQTDTDAITGRGFVGTAGDRKRIPSLDGLRGLSIWAVMIAHASSHFKASLFQNRQVHFVLASLAYFGVTVFFVISGYLITRLLLREHERTGTISLKNFYRRRAVRILPAALFYISVVLVLGSVSRNEALYALTFTTTYFYSHAAKPLQQLWSLSVEEQFYLIWPLTFCLGVLNARKVCWGIVFASPVLRFALKHHGYDDYAHFAPAIGDSIAFGCLTAFYEGRARAFVQKNLSSGWRSLLLCVTTLAVAGLLYRSTAVLLWGLVPLLIACMVVVAIERRDLFLNRGPLVWTGLLSYSLYLWQQPFLVFDGPLNKFWARIIFTFACGYLSYQWIERPSLKHFGTAGRKRGFHAAVANAQVGKDVFAGNPPF